MDLSPGRCGKDLALIHGTHSPDEPLRCPRVFFFYIALGRHSKLHLLSEIHLYSFNNTQRGAHCHDSEGVDGTNLKDLFHLYRVASTTILVKDQTITLKIGKDSTYARSQCYEIQNPKSQYYGNTNFTDIALPAPIGLSCAEMVVHRQLRQQQPDRKHLDILRHSVAHSM